MRNRVFFPQEALDRWLVEDRVDLTVQELVIKPEERRYRIVDAIRVLREVTNGDDVYDVVGKVKTVNFLAELGAELLGSSMLIGDSAYDVVSGWLGHPVDTPEEHHGRRGGERDLAANDEELLTRRLVSPTSR